MSYIFLIINISAFLLCAYDKAASKFGKVKFRISERNLILFGFLFGATGMLLAMLIFRHKTKHVNFMTIMPILSLVQLLIYFILLFNIDALAGAVAPLFSGL